MKKQNEAATCSKRRTIDVFLKEDYASRLETMTQDEKLAIALEHIQIVLTKNDYFLLWEDWDWLVVLQCLQDHGLFQKNHKRMPLSAFVKKLEELNIRVYVAHYSMRSMSYANAKINNMRYPWDGCKTMPDYIIARWQRLYRLLQYIMTKLTLCQ